VALYKETSAFSSDKKREFAPKYGHSLLHDHDHDPRSLVFNDPPLHTCVRRMIAGPFTPRAIADGLLEAMALKGSADLIADVGIGAANRDPSEFPDPDRLEIARAPNRHLAFGSGAQFCAGLNVARLEGRIAIGRFWAGSGALSGLPAQWRARARRPRPLPRFFCRFLLRLHDGEPIRPAPSRCP